MSNAADIARQRREAVLKLQPLKKVVTSNLVELQEKRQDLKNTLEDSHISRELIDLKIPGFFPTPDHLVNKMIGLADIKLGMNILEPSAGKGNIAFAIRKAGVEPVCVEINYTLSQYLYNKGFVVYNTDFMEFEPAYYYDRVIMNPPFEHGQDIKHVMKAYDLLLPTGKSRLISIMCAMSFRRSNKQTESFVNWINEKDYYSEDLPDDTFYKSERSTGVKTVLVVINK